MTRFPLQSLRLRLGEEHRDAVTIALEPLELGGQRYLPVPHEVPAELSITQATAGRMFQLRFHARLHGPCMRCLGDAVLDLPLEESEYHDADAASDELRSEHVVDDHLDLTAWARDLIAEALPAQILCRPDCAGLCPACGKDLNVEPHEHGEDSGDPRWDALKELRERL